MAEQSESPGSRKRRPSQAERVAERRRQVGQAARELIQEVGFETLSVNTVAERAGISTGGLYRYIRTKSDLLEMALDYINEGILERMVAESGRERGIGAKLQAAMAAYWEMCWDSAEALRVSYRDFPSLPKEAQKRYIAQEAEFADFLADLIRAGVAAEEFRPVDERLLAHEIILLAQMKATRGAALAGRDPKAVLAEHTELVMSRLRTTSARPG